MKKIVAFVISYLLSITFYFSQNNLNSTTKNYTDTIGYSTVETILGCKIITAEGGGVIDLNASKKNPNEIVFTSIPTSYDHLCPVNDRKDFFNCLAESKLHNFKYAQLNGHDIKNPSIQRNCRLNVKSVTAEQLTEFASHIPKTEIPKKEIPKESIMVNPKRNTADITKDIYSSNVDLNKPGLFYAIIIGISNYNDPNISDLDSLPIKDAMSMYNILNEQYTFEKENISELYNPTRRDIVTAFAEMSKKVTQNDNLLIFYAGHGHYEKDNDIGYWLPSDAEVNNPSNWLYNDQLVADVKKIKSLHTLLISDACFSGSIFKTRSVNMNEASNFVKQKYELPSKRAITSGTLKTVPNQSVFIKYLLNRLNNNSEQFFTASQLFQSIEQPVANNSPSLPQFGVIQNVGDEGGDFIFIKR